MGFHFQASLHHRLAHGLGTRRATEHIIVYLNPYGVKGFGFEQLNLIAAIPTATQENPAVETRLEILNLRGKLGGEGNRASLINNSLPCWYPKKFKKTCPIIL